MRIGQLDKKMTLLARESGRDSVGQPQVSWVTVTDFWANERGLNGIATLKANAETIVIRKSLRVRADVPGKEGMRVRFDGRDYDIKAISPSEKRARFNDWIVEYNG